MNIYKNIAYLILSLISANAISNNNQNIQEIITINGKNFKPFIRENEIAEQIKKVAAQINKDYQNSTPLFIGILSGSVIFLADLVREVGLDSEIDFIKISSYGNSLTNTKGIKLEKNASLSLTGRDVIIVEDIVDSGNSISYLRNLILESQPKSLKIATLLYKKDTAKIDFDIDYYCFNTPSKFLIGYGLDYAQHGRCLKSIYQLAD